MDLPPSVQRVLKRLRDGSTAEYFYYRPTRKKLPPPTDPGFDAAFAAAKTALTDAPPAESFGALVLEYKRSPSFRRMQPKTRAAYDRVFERLRNLERQPAASIKRRDVLALRDALAIDRPQAANQLVWVVSAVMQFAVERDWRETNPCARIGKIKGGSHRRWPDEAIDYALRKLPAEHRRAIMLALYTGQREGDCCAMRWERYDGTAIEVVPEKTRRSTGVRLWIPVHKNLKRELDAWRLEATAPTILTNTLGRPWKARSFATRFSTVLEEHAPLEGLVFHGLRKVAAARLAEAGCSTHEIAAITGHATLQMVELYTREANQKRRAKRAIGRLELVSDGAVNREKKDP